MIIPIFLSLRANSTTLIDEPFIMAQMSFWGGAIALGVWGATLSSAIGSILGAPRILQALARDRIFPRPLRILGKGSGKEDEPRIGTAVTLIIALIAVGLGDLNLIAPVLSMFFLTTYLVLNLSAGIESFLQLPSFRPTFKVHWFFSFTGALGCLAVMFLINALATVVAAVIVVAIYFYLQRKELKVTWGDSRRGIWMAFLRRGIYQVDYFPDAKNWRPHIMAFSGAPEQDELLIHLADSFNHKGFLTVATIIPEEHYQRRNYSEQKIKQHFEENKIETLVKVIAASHTFSVIPHMVETYGIGPLNPNTILLGDRHIFKSNYSHLEYKKYCQMIAAIHRLNKNVVILKAKKDQNFGNYRRIEIWWRGQQANGSLMILLAHLLRYDLHWRGANIYLKSIVKNKKKKQEIEQNLSDYINKLNINLIPEIIISPETSFEQNLRKYGQDADLIFLGLAESTQNFADYYFQWQKRTENLPPIAFVMAANDFPFEEVLEKD